MLRSWHIVICSESNKFSTQHVYKLSDVRNNNWATTWTQLARGKVKLKYNKWCLGNMTKWPLFQLCLSCFCSSYYYNLYRMMEVKIIADRVFIWWKIKASFVGAQSWWGTGFLHFFFLLKLLTRMTRTGICLSIEQIPLKD